MKYLFINTINPNLPSFAIFTKDGILAKNNFINKIENLAKGLDTFFKKNKIDYKNLAGVITINGPGSFTSSRAGVVLANSFNFLYKISVLGISDVDNMEDVIKNISKIKKGGRAEVFYNKAPNITIK